MAGHNEEVGQSFFDVNFRDALRNYYTYGFKTETNHAVWYRLKNILEDNRTHFKKESKKSAYISISSAMRAENQFHRLYRFCLSRTNDCLYFFHLVLALSPEVTLTQLQDGISDAALTEEEENELRAQVKKAPDFYTAVFKTRLSQSKRIQLLELFERIKKTLDIEGTFSLVKMSGEEKEDLVNSLTSLIMEDFLTRKEGGQRSHPTKELACFCPFETITSLAYPTLENHLADLEKLGIVSRLGKYGWQLSSRKLSGLLKEGTDKNPQFEDHLKTALLFYSRYFPLGETGTFLLDRLGGRKPGSGAFYFKNDYFMNAANDYTLIDLLHAMEHGRWCRITFREGMQGESEKLLCYPLEVRVSVSRGQECLAYYEPFSRSYDFLPLEDIDEILFYPEEELKKASLIQGEILNADLKNVRFALLKSWGTLIEGEGKGNAKKEPVVHTIRAVVDLALCQTHKDPDKKVEWEEIRERIYQAKWVRKETIRQKKTEIIFEAQTINPSELSSWLLGFADCLTDLRIDGDFAPEDFFKNSASSKHERFIPDPSMMKKLDKLQTTDEKPHEQLFHPAFSTDYHIFGDALMQFCRTGGEGKVFEKGKREGASVDDCIQKAFEKNLFMTGDKTRSNFSLRLENLLRESESPGRFLTASSSAGENEALSSLYAVNEDLDFYKDLLPLTKTEIRWLLSIFQDEKIGYFLSKEEIKAMKDALQVPKDWGAFPMEKLNFFDRPAFVKERTEKEQENVKALITAIRERHPVSIRSDYYPSGEYHPAILVFSKIRDYFYLYCFPVDVNAAYPLYQMRLPYLDTVKVLEGESFDYEEVWEKLNFYMKRNGDKYTIELPDKDALAEKILTEFAPWQKECTYDSKNEYPYSLTLHYQRDDARILAEHILSYEEELNVSEELSAVFQNMKWMKLRPSPGQVKRITKIYDEAVALDEEHPRVVASVGEKAQKDLKARYLRAGIEKEPEFDTEKFWHWWEDSMMLRTTLYDDDFNSSNGEIAALMKKGAYEEAAKKGSPQAQCQLGGYYLEKDADEHSKEYAFLCFEEAARQQYAPAQYRLGICYADGTFDEPDDEKAAKWYFDAARQEYPPAQCSLGYCYYRGTGIVKEKEKAFDLWRAAASQGYPPAQYCVAVCYANGEGVKRDDREAFLWYKRAAEQMDVHAQVNLGVCYMKGTGVEQNEEEAVKLFRRAADKNAAIAMYDLGQAYLNGAGVKADEDKARECFREAASNGYEPAQLKLDALDAENTGSPAEKSERSDRIKKDSYN